MPEVTKSSPRLCEYVRSRLTVGEPDVAGPLAVFPVFGAEPTVSYVAFAQVHGAGMQVKEREGAADVNDLLVLNSTALNVLLYEGEEVLGAQQNRTFDVSVLVAAGARLTVPVSCVEAGRWDGSRHGEGFAPAPQAAYPALRRMKNAQARASAALGLDARADQSAVWGEIARKSARHGARSQTDAMHDVFVHRRDRLDRLQRAVKLRSGQCGALGALGGRLDVFDLVSRAEVFAVLHGPLVQGYALDALEHRSRKAPTVDQAQEWLDEILTATVTETDGIGMGRDVRFAAPAGAGAGVVSGTELVQLTAFAERRTSQEPVVRRPSRRRR